jgi:hypothetical protein
MLDKNYTNNKNNMDKNNIENSNIESVKSQNPNVYTNWDHLNKSVGAEMVTPENTEIAEVKKRSIFFWFFIFGFVLLVCAAGFLAYQNYFSKNKVSTEKITFSTDIANTSESGERKLFNINVGNANNVSIQDVKIKLNYQKGFTRNGTAEVVNADFVLGEMIPNSYLATSTPFFVVGKEGDIRKIKMIMSYKVAGSNAEFTKSFEKDIKIISPSISLKIEGDNNIIDNNQTVFTFKIKNLAIKDFSKSILIVEVPPGMSIKKEDSSENVKTKFDINNLKIGEEKSFSVTGFFKNSLGETKNIRAYMAIKNEDESIGATYADQVFEMNIIQSPINYTYKIKAGNTYAESFKIGKENLLELSLKNMSENNIDEISLFLENEKTKNRINFNKNNIENLQRLMPDTEEKIEVKMDDLIVGENSYKLEIYGKRRGDTKTSLLRNDVLSFVGE